jgi:Protein of unknown function (DUF1592)/Protein of unknown function (DUF1588)/Protein of unknown function (DUF1595)/Protein of unknown function (DUF1587)
MTTRTLLLAATLVGGAVALATFSAVEVASGRARRPSVNTATTTRLNDSQRSYGQGNDCIEPACKNALLPVSSHAVLLTHAQWENTVRDLLRLPAAPGLSASFPAAPAASGADFGNDLSTLVVATTDQWQAYRGAAEVLAKRVVEDPIALARIVPAATGRGDIDSRVRLFVTDFLPRAYRRPVEDAEIDAMVRLGERAAASDARSDPFRVRVRWILTAALQTPSFLYRIEGGVAGPTDGRVRLSDYELAAKLSYTLWGTMPDDKLMGYARSKKLATTHGVAAVAREMLADPRAAWTLMDFHEQLFGVGKFESLVRQTGAFPTFYPNLGRDAQEDVRRTLKELVIDHPGTVRDLYSSDVAYVNADLAKIYGIDPATISGLDASPGSFVRVKMPPTRTGILMHVGWLAMEAHANDPSPIQRGVFMARHALCIPLSSPPPGAVNTKIDGPPGANNRGRVEATTQSLRTCSGCHARIINPMGFAFEAFDAIGAFRTRDGASAVDATGATELLGPFDGASAMLRAAQDTPNAHACYAAHWFAYLNGTSKVNAGATWLSPIVEKSRHGAPVRDLIADIVQSDAFLTVSR